MTERQTGKVKWFDDDKGYGFIERAGEKDLFVHYSAVRGSGFRSLREGDVVTYVIDRGPKGDSADDVEVVAGGAVSLPVYVGAAGGRPSGLLTLAPEAAAALAEIFRAGLPVSIGSELALNDGSAARLESLSIAAVAAEGERAA